MVQAEHLQLAGLEVRPVQPLRPPVRLRVDIDVLGERDDRDQDVVIRGGRGLQLRQQVARRALQRGHLAALRHRSGVVEDQCHAQARAAPLGGRRSGDRDGFLADHVHQRRVDVGRAVDKNLRAVLVGIGRADGDVLGFRPVQDRQQIFLGLHVERVRVLRRHALGHHQCGGVERALQRDLQRIGAAVIDRGADEGDQRDHRDAERDRDVAAFGARKGLQRGSDNPLQREAMEHF